MEKEGENLCGSPGLAREKKGGSNDATREEYPGDEGGKREEQSDKTGIISSTY